MVKYYETSNIFHFNWDQVAQGFWRRYPNPYSTHVLTEDTIFRELRGDKLYTKRLLTKTNKVPKWGERFISSRTVKIVEESIVDPKEKTLVTYTRNLGYVRVMSVLEKVTYKVSEENKNWTLATRSVWVDSQVFGFGRAIQAFGLDRIRKNCQQMAKGLDYVLQNMFPIPNSSQDDSSHQPTSTMKETFKDTAKKATELAKSKTAPIYASCQPNQT